MTTPPQQLIRSRTIATPDGVVDGYVHIHDGSIAAVLAHDASLPNAPITDIGTQWLLPGLVDTHVHVNEPGRAEWEGWATASRAAAAGGTTTIVDMPLNSTPVTIDEASLDAKLEAAAAASIVDHACWLGLVPANAAGLDAGLLRRTCGVKAFLSDSGLDEFPAVSMQHIDQALPLLARLRLPLLVHAELVTDEPEWSGSDRSHAAWAATRPERFEHDAVRELALAAALHGAHVHIVHVSSPESIAIAAAALASASDSGQLAAGARVTFETCPHYLTFAAESVPDGATQFKCAPPLRPDDIREQLRAWVASEIPAIVSDHSPAPPHLKSVDTGSFRSAWGGIASLQLTLSTLHTALGNRPLALPIPLALATMCSQRPAQLAGLPNKGCIAPGNDADLVAFDPTDTWHVRGADLEHRWPLTPYEGMQLTGRVSRTWLRGRTIFEREAAHPFAGADPAYAHSLTATSFVTPSADKEPA